MRTLMREQPFSPLASSWLYAYEIPSVTLRAHKLRPFSSDSSASASSASATASSSSSSSCSSTSSSRWLLVKVGISGPLNLQRRLLSEWKEVLPRRCKYLRSLSSLSPWAFAKQAKAQRLPELLFVAPVDIGYEEAYRRAVGINLGSAACNHLLLARMRKVFGPQLTALASERKRLSELIRSHYKSASSCNSSTSSGGSSSSRHSNSNSNSSNSNSNKNENKSSKAPPTTRSLVATALDGARAMSSRQRYASSDAQRLESIAVALRCVRDRGARHARRMLARLRTEHRQVEQAKTAAQRAEALDKLRSTAAMLAACLQAFLHRADADDIRKQERRLRRLLSTAQRRPHRALDLTPADWRALGTCALTAASGPAQRGMRSWPSVLGSKVVSLGPTELVASPAARCGALRRAFATQTDKSPRSLFAFARTTLQASVSSWHDLASALASVHLHAPNKRAEPQTVLLRSPHPSNTPWPW